MDSLFCWLESSRADDIRPYTCTRKSKFKLKQTVSNCGMPRKSDCRGGYHPPAPPAERSFSQFPQDQIGCAVGDSLHPQYTRMRGVFLPHQIAKRRAVVVSMHDMDAIDAPASPQLRFQRDLRLILRFSVQVERHRGRRRSGRLLHGSFPVLFTESLRVGIRPGEILPFPAVHAVQLFGREQPLRDALRFGIKLVKLSSDGCAAYGRNPKVL